MTYYSHTIYYVLYWKIIHLKWNLWNEALIILSSQSNDILIRCTVPLKKANPFPVTKILAATLQMIMMMILFSLSPLFFLINQQCYLLFLMSSGAVSCLLQPAHKPSSRFLKPNFFRDLTLSYAKRTWKTKS